MLPVHYGSASMMTFTSAYVLAPASPPSLAALPVCFHISFQPPTLHIPIMNHCLKRFGQVWRVAFREAVIIGVIGLSVGGEVKHQVAPQKAR